MTSLLDHSFSSLITFYLLFLPYPLESTARCFPRDYQPLFHFAPSFPSAHRRRRTRSSRMRRSARLTKLRTSKHETELSGKPVMVHRCQGEYFRQLLKPIT